MIMLIDFLDRKIWKELNNFTNDVDGIIFVVDSTDRSKFSIIKKELKVKIFTKLTKIQELLKCQLYRHIPFLILANKSDSILSLPETDIGIKLGISDKRTGKLRTELTRQPLEIFSCSALQNRGFHEALRWLVRHIR